MRDSEFEELMRRHPELRPLFERVSGSYRARAHWRLKAKWKRDPRFRPESLLRTHIALGEVAYASFGKKGFDEDGNPIVCGAVKKAMKGRKFKKVRKPEWKRMLERIKKEVEVKA